MTETGREILSLAQHYLLTLGFNGFSFQDIADKLKIKKASIHYHFKSKEELGIKLIESYEDLFVDWIARKSALPPAERLTDFFKMNHVIHKDENKICPMGVFCAEYSHLPASMKKALNSFHTLQRSWLKSVLQEGKKQKVFRYKEDEEVLVTLIIGQLQGSLQLMRLTQDSQTIKKIGQFWLSYLQN